MDVQTVGRVGHLSGVWISKLVGTLVGYEGLDAFSVVQTYDWTQGVKGCKKWRLGFREKQDMRMRRRDIMDLPPRCMGPFPKSSGEDKRLPRPSSPYLLN
jgi:hypothetical protein